MRYKIMILTIILVCLLAISTVSAADNTTDDIVGVEETTNDVISVDVASENNNLRGLENQNTNELNSPDGESETNGTFTELATKINSSGNEITLDKDYSFNDTTDSGLCMIDSLSIIEINKPISIDGQGNTIYLGKSMYSLFKITSDNVTFKNTNIKIISKRYSENFVIMDANNISNLNIINCSLIGDNKAPINFIYLEESNNTSIVNCTFKNVGLSVDSGCVIVVHGGNNTHMYNCNFIDCYGKSISMGSTKNTKIQSCKLTNCYGEYSVVDLSSEIDMFDTNIFYYNENGTITDCIFNNTGSDNRIVNIGFNCTLNNCTFIKNVGPVVEIYDGGIINNCIFINSTTPSYGYGSAVIIDRCGKVTNCIFINSTVAENGNRCNGNGGSIFLNSGDGIICNCTFINSSATNNGGAIYSIGTYLTIDNNTFINCNAPAGKSIYMMADGIIKNNYFDNNDSIFTLRNVKIIKKSSSLYCENITFVFQDNANLSAYLNHRGEVIFNLINENGNKVFILNVSDDGIVTLYNELKELNSGIWNVTVIYNGDYNYAPCNTTATITVLPPNSSVTIEEVNATVGHEITLVANVNSSLTVNEGSVIFFDGETSIGESPVYNGVATLTYTPTTAGEHTITAKYTSDNYQGSNSSAILSVAKAEIDLNIDYISTVLFSNPSNFAVNVNSNSKRVNEGTVKYYINDELIGSSDVFDGVSTYSYITNTTGSFDLLVVYNETDNYLDRNASTTFYVNQMPTTLTGESIIFDEQAYKTFTTELKDDNNYGVNGQTVRIEVIKYSGESATFTGVSDSNGITLYDVGNLAGGMWYVAGNYAGNENYLESNFADKFIVVRMNTTTQIEQISNAQVNHTYKLKANIHDENGKLVKEGIVQFYLDGVDIGSIDLSKNQGHQSALSESVLGAVNPVFEYILGADDDTSDLYINYVPTKAGDHTLTAVYEGTTIYKSSNSTTTFTVSDVNVEPEIVIPLLDNVSNNETIEVKLPDDATGTVTLTVNGKDYVFDVVSGKSDVKLPELDNGNYNYTITYSGDDKYSSFSKSASLTINKIIPTTISASKVSTAYNGGKYITAILKDSNGNPLNGVNVTVKFSNGKTSTAKTDKNGQVKISTDKLAPVKKYTATIIFAGNSKYAKSTKTVNVYVVKANLKVTPTLKKYKANVKYKKYYVTVKNSKNQKLKNIKVSIIVKGKTFSAYTLKNGVATLKVTNLLKKGTYKAYVSFAGSKYYNKISKKVYIKVK